MTTTKQNIFSIIIFLIVIGYYCYLMHQDTKAVKEYTVALQRNTTIDSLLILKLDTLQQQADRLEQKGILKND